MSGIIASAATPLGEILFVTTVLAVLVRIFVYVPRQSGCSERIRLWAYAWALAFLHFVAQALEPHIHGAVGHLIFAVDFAILDLSGLVFLSSFVFAATDHKRRNALLALLGVPMVSVSFAMGFGWAGPWLSAASLTIIYGGAAAFLLVAARRWTFLRIGGATLLAGLGLLVVRAAFRSGPNAGVDIMLMLTYGLCGVFFWRLYRRRSLGVIAVTGGFFGWMALFPLAALLHSLGPKYSVLLDFRSVPQIFVAVGMVLTVVEDYLRIIEQAKVRAQAETRLLERLSQITSRLLAGNDPVTLCGEVASAITDATNFRRAALFLLGDDRRLYLAGASGFTPEESEKLREQSGRYTIEALEDSHAKGSRLGNNSFRLSGAENRMLVPLVSRRGSQEGCLYLLGSTEAGGADPPEMVRLEAFASDLAVTIENIRLHQQLVRSDKLAALGQLVAGVAHELNNPLTGIIGYTDLLGGEVGGQTAAKHVEKLGKEARRMKRILDGLLRFARQNNSAPRLTSLETVLHDVIQLQEYRLRKGGIRVEVQAEPALPPVAIGEDELKQVLLNILNNAIDAVEESARREILIRASHHSGRVVISFEDSGPGFADVNRAFDPFYTTKPIGKGTGLGLSICYGVVQECGGKITIANKQPYGASAVIDLAAAVAETESAVLQPALAVNCS
jgi:two-component system, NtrC family, sensor kinase